MSQFHFFALKNDLLPVLEGVDGKEPSLKYVRAGGFATDVLEPLFRGSDIPNLGIANSASAITCATFLVTESAIPVELRAQNAVTSKRFFVDQLVNPDTVMFTPGGLWKEEMILFGRVATVSKSKIAQALMRRFTSQFKKRFRKVRAFWVGPHALAFLEVGKRLTTAEQSSGDSDLRME